MKRKLLVIGYWLMAVAAPLAQADIITPDGSATVTSFSAGNLSPLFTTSEATATTTPALTFDLSNAAAHTLFGNFTGSSAAASYNVLGTGVDAALVINVGSAGAFITNGGALGTPSSGTLTNATGLPESGVTNLVSDLALKAPLDSPTFTGAVTGLSAIISNITGAGFNFIAEQATVQKFFIYDWNDGRTTIGTNGASQYLTFQINGIEPMRITTTGVTIGGGTAIAKVISATATLDFGLTAAGASTDLTITVTGAALGDQVAIGVPNASVPAGGTVFGWVSATDTVTIRYANNSLLTTYNPPSGTFRAVITQF